MVALQYRLHWSPIFKKAAINWKYANHQQGNHAALHMGQALDGIIEMDQWSGKRPGAVTSRTVRSKGQYKNGLHIDPSNNADAFFVIE
ncbi:BPSL0067 family protein [Janthinobacterium sp. UMAB-60]|uniref:BPSL0067 family protein n=1 Tax=Janthinobacterium sp. UMAB-60 TaxID=1365365 RepID=UPI001C57010B|nr:BPSL0067 family protein [Janthinobacterium sp. UMAB-60]